MTLFAWAAIGVGVAAVCCLLSVMYGFESALKTRVLTASPHISIEPKGGQIVLMDDSITHALETAQGVDHVVAFVEREMIAMSEDRSYGVVVRGIRESDFKHWLIGLKAGGIPSLESKLPGVVVGSELANQLEVSVGDEIRLLSPTQRSGGIGGQVPRSATFVVSGLYTSGHYEFDHQFLIMLLEDASDLLRVGKSISGWQVWTKDLDDSQKIADQLQTMLPENLVAIHWSEQNAALFQSLKLEQFAMGFILGLAILIAMMNMVITLTTQVTAKRKHIGVFRALGASKQQIKSMFMWQGIWLGVSGIGLAALLITGFIIFVKNFSTFQLPDIYYDRSIPIEVRPLTFFIVFFVAMVFIFLSTQFPSRKAANMDPIEAIRE